jgi:hypothetical protein
MSFRPVIKSKPTLEGAGVHLRRALSFGHTTEFDPFLLLDELRSSIPEDYMSGSHGIPRCGIETISHVPAGTSITTTAWGIVGTIGDW